MKKPEPHDFPVDARRLKDRPQYIAEGLTADDYEDAADVWGVDDESTPFAIRFAQVFNFLKARRDWRKNETTR
jgi:hypothetical protein